MYEIHIKLATGPKAEGQQRQQQQWLMGHKGEGGGEVRWGYAANWKEPPAIEWATVEPAAGPGGHREAAATHRRPIDPPNRPSDELTLFLLFYNQLCHAHSAKIFHCTHNNYTHTHTIHSNYTHTHTHWQAHTMLNCNGRRWSRIGIWYLPHTAHTFTYPHTHTHTWRQTDRDIRHAPDCT